MDYKTHTTSPTKTLPVNLNSFYTISVIGKGSYAKVILVKKKDTGKYYAMKVLKKQNIEKKRQENHVKTERNILVGIDDNPYIVKLYYTFQNDKKLYFVLEYCPGGELFNLLQKKKRLSEEQAQFYGAQMVLALEHLHRFDIIYRDLKPENVLITETGYIKITDFGLSRMNVKENDAKSICGTPEYLAPEIIMKLGYGKAVDWWTLGSIIYEMLVGIPPFYTQNRQELFEKIKFVSPKYPNYLSSTAKSLIEGLLRKDPTKRLGSQRGAQEIKDHPWFANIDWKKMEEQKYEPFFRPKINVDMGLHNFDPEFTEMPINSLEVSHEQTGPFKKFEEFSWNSDAIEIKKVEEVQNDNQMNMEKIEEIDEDNPDKMIEE
jgi:serum/glucocorticoid-regulated kinase 2